MGEAQETLRKVWARPRISSQPRHPIDVVGSGTHYGSSTWEGRGGPGRNPTYRQPTSTEPVP